MIMRAIRNLIADFADLRSLEIENRRDAERELARYENELRRELNRRVPWHQREASGLVSFVTLSLFGATVFVLTLIISGH